MKFDLKNLSTLDRAIAGGAGVAFIAGFLPWWGVSNDLFGVSVSGWSAAMDESGRSTKPGITAKVS